MGYVVVYCEQRIALYVNYYTNAIVDTIVNVISEVWIELSAQTACNCVTSFSKIVFIVILDSRAWDYSRSNSFILTLFK